MSLVREFPSSPRLAGLVAAGCVLMAVAIPAYVLCQWGMASPEQLAEARLSPVAAETLAPSGSLVPLQRLTGAALGLVPGLLLSWGLIRARGALLAIGAGRFFAPEVVLGLRAYAGAAFLAAIASFVMQPLLSVLLTIANPPGHRMLTLGVTSGQLFQVLGAGILWVIVAALAKGASAAHENEQFV